MRKNFLSLLLLAIAAVSASAQTFEEPKDKGEAFEKPSVKVGGDFALQFQALSHKDDANNLIALGKGFNLPTANLNLDAYLAKGVKLNLVTYLASRHHNDTWVKGGYIQFDQLPFFKSTTVDNIMNYVTIKVGEMELNYGDEHFRRTDNGNAIRNVFVGNYIMDAFTTAPAVEILVRNNGLFAMGAVTSGTLKQDLAGYSASSKTYTAYNTLDELAYYGKVGYDNALSADSRLRLSLSGYYCAKNHFGSLYYGDRTGSRYYLIMNTQTNSATDVDITTNHMSGTWGPGLSQKDGSVMFNAFYKISDLELFGTFENAKTKSLANADLSFQQVAVEGIYHFGSEKQFYGGARYNKVFGDTKTSTTETKQNIDRTQLVLGWYLLPSTVAKLEYVRQNYNDFAQYGGHGQFSGIMFEAAVSF